MTLKRMICSLNFFIPKCRHAMLSEVFRLAFHKPLGVDESQVADVGLLSRDQLRENQQFRLRIEHHRRGMDFHLLARIKLKKKYFKFIFFAKAT